MRQICCAAAGENGFLCPRTTPCAGVTTYKGFKETEARPGQSVAISGPGGLGHIPVQYAKAMGLHVVALDVTDEKFALAHGLGAEVTVNANRPMPWHRF